ncbi:MAG: polysulfide reductase NrfD [Acidobacteriota bacterium]|nr:polysulfide reductase NrfD [Acidobacteriota bacterium]
MSVARYEHSVEPVYTDGRDIDLDVGELTGEAANQKSSGSSDKHIQSLAQTWKQLPEPQTSDPTYYDRPMLQESIWGWAIPTYYYVGGLTGASLALGAAVMLRRDPELETLVDRCHLIGFIGATISGALLVYDLGRPERFLNMLRVFRPTSPMNMGAWILSATAAAATGAVLLRRRRSGFLRLLGNACGFAAGVFGLGLATYTGVLVANTAVPLWQQSRKVLPALFGASAIASVGCTFDIFWENEKQRRITNLFGNVGRVAELASEIVMERQASVVPRVGRPLKRGLSGLMWRSSELLMAASLLVSVLPGQTRRKRVTAGVLGTLGSLLLRFTIERAGDASARDARASFHQQRAGHGAAHDTV